jgi:hypothetical protein
VVPRLDTVRGNKEDFQNQEVKKCLNRIDLNYLIAVCVCVAALGSGPFSVWVWRCALCE